MKHKRCSATPSRMSNLKQFPPCLCRSDGEWPFVVIVAVFLCEFASSYPRSALFRTLLGLWFAQRLDRFPHICWSFWLRWRLEKPLTGRLRLLGRGRPGWRGRSCTEGFCHGGKWGCQHRGCAWLQLDWTGNLNFTPIFRRGCFWAVFVGIADKRVWILPGLVASYMEHTATLTAPDEDLNSSSY